MNFLLNHVWGRKLAFTIATILIMGINPGFKNKEPLISLIILDPGHGHATFMQGAMNPAINPVVYVYAPEGPGLQIYMNSITRSNSRSSNPTNWKIILYKGEDYLEKMLEEKKGNAVVISGNNRKKSNYIQSAIKGGFHVLADKPMAITPADFKLLQKAFQSAEKNRLLLFDSMDLRYDISNILQKELSQISGIFGTLQKGTIKDPAIIQANVHHYLKFSGGEAIMRPAWFFDTEQQGHGIVDVSTHLVDMAQWAAFPGMILNYKKDIRVLTSKEWPTKLTPSQFKLITREEAYPEYLQKDIKDSIISVYSNGEMNYTIKGIHARASVIWNYKEPTGSGDSHYALMRGTKANLEIRQGESEQHRPTLYIEPSSEINLTEFEAELLKAQTELQKKYPGLEFIKKGKAWIVKPGSFKKTNAAEVAISYLKNLRLPDWEVPNMLAKYYTTTQALKKAKRVVEH